MLPPVEKKNISHGTLLSVHVEGIRAESIVIGLGAHSFRVKERRMMMTLRQGCVSLRVVDVWNGLPRKLVVAEPVNEFERELDRYTTLKSWCLRGI